MIIGHYAAALIPYSRLKAYPFWLLLLCANVPEFLWLGLALLGVEPVSPSSMLDATLKDLHVAMTYSHNLVPGLVQGGLVATIVFAWFCNRPLAVWCGILTVLHVLCDLVVGFDHQLMTPDSLRVSLNSYATMPYVALAIEVTFCVGCICWYQFAEKKQGRAVPSKRIFALYAVFIVGVAIWIPTATVSLKEQLHSLGIAL